MPSSDVHTMVASLSELPANGRLFNPYAPLDDPQAAVRRGNLTRYLTQMSARGPRVLLLFEAPGYRGCKVSGVPVTSERIMMAGVEKWGLFGEGYRPTSDNPDYVAEMTATILWGALVEHMDEPPLIWNTVPLHPHRPGDRYSNRTPTVGEIRMGQPFVEQIMAMYPLEVVVGVGRKAQRTLQELGIEHAEVRHPSQGGKADFIAGLKAVTAALG